MKLFLISISRKFAYILAGCVILLALLVATSRFVIHSFDIHKHEIETWASTLLNAPVKIELARLDWYQYQPEITLENVTLLNKKTNQPTLAFEHIRIFFSLPKSIWQRTPVPSGIMISGVAVKIKQNDKQEFLVQGMPVLSSKNVTALEGENKATDVLAWLSTQEKLILNDITVNFTDTKNHEHQLFLDNLSVGNNGDDHVIMALARLQQAIPTRMTLAVTWHGDVTALDKINADIYLYLSSVSLSQWLTAHTFQGFQIKEGIGSAKIWLKWRANQLTEAQTKVVLYGVTVDNPTNGYQQEISRFSGHLGWRKEGDHEVIAGDDVLLDLPAHLWPITHFQLSYSQDANASFNPRALHVGYLNIKDVQALLFSLPAALSVKETDELKALQPEGVIENLTIMLPNNWQHDASLSLRARIKNVGFNQAFNLPAMKNVTGQVSWDGLAGRVKLNSKKTAFVYDAIFPEPLVFNALNADLEFHQNQEKRWALTLNALHLDNNDLSFDASGTLVFNKNLVPTIDLASTFALHEAPSVWRYLPLKKFKKPLNDWLKRAFLSGEVTSGYAKVRGELTHFPFNNDQEGLFEIGGTVSGVRLSYAPEWPFVENIAGKVLFHNRSMTVDVVKASTVTVDTQTVHANIPYLGDDKPAILTVQTNAIETKGEAGLEFVNASPLKDTIGKMFNRMKLEGPIDVTLGLTVPLERPEGTRVNGEIQFKNTTLNLAPWKLAAKKINGELQFTESATTAKNLTGILFNKLFSLSLNTQTNKQKDSIVNAAMQFQANAADLDEWLSIPFTKWVQGGATFNADLNVSLDAPLKVKLKSNLVGMAVALPDQYGKTKEAALPFTADLTLSEDQPVKIQMQYGDLLSAALLLTKENDQFILKGGNIGLGAKMADWPKESGLLISGALDKLDLPTIQKYASGMSGDASASSPVLFRGIDLQINALDLSAITLKNAHLQVLPYSSYWDIDIDSNAISGKIKLPKILSADSVIVADIDKFTFVSQTKPTLPAQFDIKTLPGLSIEADNVRYNDIPIGTLTLETRPAANGMEIQTLNIRSDLMTVTSSGKWLQQGEKQQTFLQGKANTSKLSKFLDSLGYDANNFVAGPARFTFDIDYNGSLYSPDLPSLDGKLSIFIDKGRMIDLGKESNAKMDLGRMLNIFSLQTIPRRLSLDFSDMFQKGYSFDVLRGDVAFENGDAYTKNLFFEGPVARVGISGRIGLFEKDYDMRLSVTPHVTSSIPIAATLITGQPVIGIAAWAFDKVISPQVSKVTTHYYDIKGSWKNPVWSEVKARDR